MKLRGAAPDTRKKKTPPAKPGKKKPTVDMFALPPEALANLDGVHISFAKRLKKLRGLSKENPNLDPKYQLMLYRALLDSSCAILAVLDEKIHESDNGGRLIYAHNNVTSQIREIVNDMRTVSTNEHQVEKVLELLKGALTGVAQNMVDAVFLLRRQLNEVVPPKHGKAAQASVDKLLANNAKVLSETFKMLEQQITLFFAVKK